MELKDLISRMLSFDPSNRPTISQIREHPWMKKETSKSLNFYQDFLLRRQQVEAAKKKEQEAKHNLKNTSITFGGKKYRTAEKDKEFEGKQLKKYQPIEGLMTIQPYNLDEKDIMIPISKYISDRNGNFQLHHKWMKSFIELMVNESKIKFTVEVMEDGIQKYLVVKKKEGSVISFIGMYQELIQNIC